MDKRLSTVLGSIRYWCTSRAECGKRRLLKVHKEILLELPWVLFSILNIQENSSYNSSVEKAGGLFLETFIWEDGFGNIGHISYLIRDVFCNHPT